MPCTAGEDACGSSTALGRRSGCGQLAGSNFVLDRLVEGETVAEVLQNAQHQVPALKHALAGSKRQPVLAHNHAQRRRC